MNHVIINGNKVEKIEYKGQAVITLNMIDELHERPMSTARQAFNRNKERFIEYEDYFEVAYEDWKQFLVVRNSYDQKGGHRGNMNFITQNGYLMLVKSFNDDLAWRVQRELVNRYFVVEQIKNDLNADILSFFNHKGIKLNQRLKVMNLSRQMSEMDNAGQVEMMTRYNILCGILKHDENVREKTKNDETLKKSGFYEFLDECCVVDPDLEVSKNSLYDAYKKYASGNGYVPIFRNNFFQYLYKTEDVSAYRARFKERRTWRLKGIGLKR